VLNEKPLSHNFVQIRENRDFLAFKEIFGKAKHTNLNLLMAEEFFLQTFEKINESYNKILSATIADLNVKINQIQNDLLKKL
jgi:hypothetical protein